MSSRFRLPRHGHNHRVKKNADTGLWVSGGSDDIPGLDDALNDVQILTTTDGSTTVAPTLELDIGAGLALTDLGGGVAKLRVPSPGLVTGYVNGGAHSPTSFHIGNYNVLGGDFQSGTSNFSGESPTVWTLEGSDWDGDVTHPGVLLSTPNPCLAHFAGWVAAKFNAIGTFEPQQCAVEVIPWVYGHGAGDGAGVRSWHPMFEEAPSQLAPGTPGGRYQDPAVELNSVYVGCSGMLWLFNEPGLTLVQKYGVSMRFRSPDAWVAPLTDLTWNAGLGLAHVGADL